MPVPPWRTPGVMLVWYASLPSLALEVLEVLQNSEIDLSLMDAFQLDPSLPTKGALDAKSCDTDNVMMENGELFEKEPIPIIPCPETPSLLSKILKPERSVPICYGTRDAWPINWGWGSFGATMIM